MTSAVEFIDTLEDAKRTGNPPHTLVEARDREIWEAGVRAFKEFVWTQGERDLDVLEQQLIAQGPK
jgi:hypothetical protein